MPKKDSAPPHTHPAAVRPPASFVVNEQELLQRRAATAMQRIQATASAGIQPQDVLVLQRTLGNRAVQRLLAPAPASSAPVIQRGKKDGEKKKKKKVLTQPEGKIEKPQTKKAQKQKVEKKAKQKDTMVANANTSADPATPKSTNPIDRLRRSSARNEKKKATPKNRRKLHETQQKHSYGYDNTKIDTGLIKGNFSQGRGGQPNFTMNKDDYGGAVVKNDYDAIIAVIQKEMRQRDAPPEMEIAKDMLAYIEKGVFDQEKYSAEMCRAAAALISLTQIIESHNTREPSADKWARACLRSIASGASTFKLEFNRKGGNYIPARATTVGAKAGGQEATRLALGKERKESDKATEAQVLHDGWDASLAFLSDSSEEEGMVQEPKESKSTGDDVEEQAIETEGQGWDDGFFYHPNKQEQSIEIVGYDEYYGNESREQPIETEVPHWYAGGYANPEGQEQPIEIEVPNVNNARNNAGGDFDGDDF